MKADALVSVIAGIFTVGSVVLSFVVAARARKREAETDRSDLLNTVNSAAHEMIESLQEETERLRATWASDRESWANERLALKAEIAAQSLEIVKLRAEITSMQLEVLQLRTALDAMKASDTVKQTAEAARTVVRLDAKVAEDVVRKSQDSGRRRRQQDDPLK